MKKKTFIYVTFLIMIIVLSACGQDKTKESKSENTKKEVTLSDVLNDKHERKIVMTHDSGYYSSPDIMWAGTIGNGKVEIHPYYNIEKFIFEDVKDIPMSEYKDYLKVYDDKYAKFPANKNKKLNIKPVEAKVKLLKSKDNENKASAVALEYDAQYYNDDDKYEMLLRGYDRVGNNNPKGWMSIQSVTKDSKHPYVINIEAKNGEESMKIENINEAKKKYKNVMVVDK